MLTVSNVSIYRDRNFQGLCIPSFSANAPRTYSIQRSDVFSLLFFLLYVGTIFNVSKGKPGTGTILRKKYK